MPELVTPVEYVRIDYICDECGKGKMLQDGNIVLTSTPVQIPHKCDKCGFIVNFKNSPYPRNGYRDWV